ncbi:MAG: phenylalanine--tRNA ligase subunit beta [Methermicoccaceae archaeon]
MPVITIDLNDMEQLTGIKRDLFLERVPLLGSDIERVEDNHADIEFFPDRPDLYCVEGVARAMRGFLGIETGLATYEVAKPRIELFKDTSIMPVRPYIACGVVRNVHFTDASIRSLMELQEDLHWALGRDRKKVSIGVHDLSRVEPPFTYKAVPPSFEFVPLGFEEKMSMREILERHPKGIEYGHIISGFERYPLIVDVHENVLSFPPIINGTLTRITEESTELFIDVTGTDRAVYTALNIVITALAERGGRIEAVRVFEPEGRAPKLTPELTPKRRRLALDEVCSLVGVPLTMEEACECLERMRFGARPEGHDIIVDIPAYRADVIHDWDIIEDVAIGYGYEHIPHELPQTSTVGVPHPLSEAKASLREVMVGMGFLEVMPFSLTCERVHYEWMGREDRGESTKVLHPISEEHTMVRASLLPSLLEILSLNLHRELPHRLFCVGDVLRWGKTCTNLACVCAHPTANFTEMKSYVLSLMHEVGLECVLEEEHDPAFIEGRQARLLTDGKRVAIFGEVHPKVVLNFSLESPVVGCEVELPERLWMREQQ